MARRPLVAASAAPAEAAADGPVVDALGEAVGPKEVGMLGTLGEDLELVELNDVAAGRGGE